MWLTVEMLSERGYSPSLAKGMACSFLELQTLLILRSKEDLLVSCVLPPWKKCWVYRLAPHFCTGPWQESQLQRDSLPSSLSLYSYGDSQERGSQINVKVQILHPFIQGFGITSESPLGWEGDSTHTAFPK